MTNTQIALIKQYILAYQDFPKTGILFRDIFGVFSNVEAAKALHSVLTQCTDKLKGKISAVVGLESRGFLLGPQIALHLNVPFVPIRKKGKLPGNVRAIQYELEYGTDEFEIQTYPFTKQQNVLIVDDLLATGGSLKAACHLIESVGGRVELCLVVIELVDLKGRDELKVPVESIITF